MQTLNGSEDQQLAKVVLPATFHKKKREYTLTVRDMWRLRQEKHYQNIWLNDLVLLLQFCVHTCTYDLHVVNQCFVTMMPTQC